VLIIKTIAELKTSLNLEKSGLKIGLVPTMGAFHQGHISLVKRAIQECDRVVVSIFVNPLQFSPTEDLAQYPRQLATDSAFCEELGVDIVFAPTAIALGITGNTATQEQITTVIPSTTMTSGLCGKYRPGHFTGVATIVTKLLNIVQPDSAYFGEKDAQQLAIIRRLVADLNLPVKIIGCPIIREASGLALSSRNQYLSTTEKSHANILYNSLKQVLQAFLQGETQANKLTKIAQESLATVDEVQVQYIELVDPLTLRPLKQVEMTGLLAIAAYLGNTRLIDNIILRQPIIAIDGPAGAGKSTVTRQVAEQLRLLYLDTGAMVIRTPEVTANVSAVAAQAAVRQELVKAQQLCGEKGGVIAEGRDIGTNVYPDADLKIFLTASAAERARRRSMDLKNQGQENIDLEKLQQEIQIRDEKDSSREIAPLKKADDAIEVITDGLTIEEVVAKIVDLYQTSGGEKQLSS